MKPRPFKSTHQPGSDRWRYLASGMLLLGMLLAQTRAQTMQEALDNSLAWTPGGAAAWYGQNSYTHDGVDAAAAGGIGDNQACWIETTVNGPGSIQFWWKVSSETNYDYLSFVIDGITNAAISGEVDWQLQTNHLATGSHTLRWVYAKDKAIASGLDRGFLDQVSFITPAAVITSQPQGVHQRQGSTVSLNVGTTGDLLTFQWRRNGISVPGATDTTLTLSNALATLSGGYDVVVTNIHNAVTSAVAVVDIYVPLPMAIRGTNVGVVLGWGNNTYGQLNPPADLTNAVAVAGGDLFSVALRNDGNVVAWGYGSECRTCVPAGLSNVVAIACGSTHSLALRDDGTVVAWGYGGDCRTCVPPGLSNVVAIAAGSDHSVALRDDSTIVAWGANSYGQLNVLSNLTDATAIACGYQHTLALKINGTVVGWGRNDFGQVSGASNVANAIGVSASPWNLASVALRSDGTVRAWGYSPNGETNVPPGLTGIAGVYAGAGCNLALRQDGTVTGWGSDFPSVPASLNNIVAVAAGGGFVLAVVTIPLVSPVDTIAPEGSNASFDVTAQGPGAFGYQWYFNGVAVPGATNAGLVLSNVALADAGNYSVLVTSDQRQALSRPAKLTVTSRNDAFAQRIVAGGGGGRFLGNNTTASAELGEPNHANAFGYHSLWYAWTAPANGTVTIDTIGSTFDTVLAVYTGDNFGNLILQAADDDGANFNRNSLLTMNCTAGVTYLIAVDGFLGATGGVVLDITPVLSIPISGLADNNNYGMTIFAPARRKVALERSANLQDWTPVATNTTPSDGLLPLSQPVTDASARFFRARLVNP